MGHRLGLSLLVVALLAGCTTGYNRVLFVTKSNIGLDVDKDPPTAQVSLGRREGGILPVFEDGKTPPVIASFRFDWKGITGLFANVAATFAGGDAAKTMSRDFGAGTPVAQDSTLCLKTKPDQASGLGEPLRDPRVIRPFFFGTDTSVGLKVAWSGLTGEVPDTFRFG